MILYIAVAVITVLLATMVNNHAIQLNNGQPTRQRMMNQICIIVVFIILFGLSALRVNVGNDYAKYVEFMHRLYTSQYISDPGVPTEWGFNLLAMVVYTLSGYENFLLVFAIYAFVTVAFFLAALYEQSVEFPFSFFMFMALGYYYQSFSTVRYYLALGMALYSMKYVLRKQWIRFLLLVFVGSAFHKSILVIIPLYILATYAWKKWQLVILLCLFSTGLFLQDFYLKVVVFLYPSYEDTEYLDGSGLSYINILRCVAILVLALICYRESIQNNKTNQFYFYLNLAALCLYVFGSFLPIISRIGYYLTVSHILFVPALLQGMESEKKRKFFRFTVICGCILYFIMYLLKADNDGVLVLPYKSFLFQDMVNILSDVA